MSATESSPITRSTAVRRRVHRGSGLVGALVVNAVLWLIGRALGADYRISDSTGSVMIDLVTAVVFTGIFGLLGWGALALLERFTRYARASWTVLAIVVTLLSLVPIFLVDATVATQVALTVLHLAPAAVIVPVFRRAF